MAVSSMTGFARAAGSSGGWRWAFEIKSVNAKGLDLRLRMPPPFDRVEAEARTRLAKALARGTCFATLTAQREGSAITVRIDQAALATIAVVARNAAEKAGLAPPTMDGLIALRGVVETVEAADDEAQVNAACAGALASLEEALARSARCAGARAKRSLSCSGNSSAPSKPLRLRPRPIRPGGPRRCARALPRASPR